MAQSFILIGQSDTAGNAVGVLVLLVIGVIGLLFYLLPTFIAGMRGHQNTAAIVVLNLLLGWTFIGWVVALVWSFTAIEPSHGSRDI